MLMADDVAETGVASVTFTVKVNRPVAVGLPEMTPVLALSVKPPEAARCRAPAPTCKVCARQTHRVAANSPCSASRPEDLPHVVTTSGGGSITIVKVLDVTLSGCESVSLTVNVNVPKSVGVPEITPDAAFNVRPSGRLPLAFAQEYGVTPPLP